MNKKTGRREIERLQNALGDPPQASLRTSRRRVADWFAQTAPLIQWDVTPSPLGPLYVAVSQRGLCRLDFDVSQADFISQLDPLARTEKSPVALAATIEQLQAYFAGDRFQFELPLDLSRTTPFQKRVLQTALRIPTGTTWTYGQLAQSLDKPQASRAVGQALGRNPVPIVVPCHRVIGSDGGLRGYGAGRGLESKRWLLRLEGAL